MRERAGVHALSSRVIEEKGASESERARELKSDRMGTRARASGKMRARASVSS